MKKQMKRWASSLATVILMATFVLNGTNKDLKNLIIPEADACSCSHSLVTGAKTLNVPSTVHTIIVTVFPEAPLNSGTFEATYTGSGAPDFVVNSVSHTTSATVSIVGKTVTISNIPPTGLPSVFHVQGTFTAPGVKTLFVLGSNLMSVTTGIVDGGNCNSLSGGYTVTAALNPPTISATPSLHTVTHSDDLAGPDLYDYSLQMDDGDTVTQSSSISMSCPAGWAFTGPTSGNDNWSSNLRKTYTRNGPQNESCTVTVTDPQGTDQTSVTFTATNSPLSATNDCELIMVGGKPLNQLRSGDIVAPTPFTLTHTLVDADDTTADRTGPAYPTGIAPTTGLEPFFSNPLTVGVPYAVSYTISPGFTGGSLTETFFNHEPAYSSCQIGPSGSSLYELFISYGIYLGELVDESVTHLGPTISYGTDVTSRVCREVAYNSESEDILNGKSFEFSVSNTHGSAGNPPPSGNPPGLGDGFSYGDPEADIDLGRPL
jgi:hypothetical protein